MIPLELKMPRVNTPTVATVTPTPVTQPTAQATEEAPAPRTTPTPRPQPTFTPPPSYSGTAVATPTPPPTKGAASQWSMNPFAQGLRNTLSTVAGIKPQNNGPISLQGATTGGLKPPTISTATTDAATLAARAAKMGPPAPAPTSTAPSTTPSTAPNAAGTSPSDGALPPNITAAVDPEKATSAVYGYITKAMNQGIKLTPEEEQDFINNLTVATGLDQPLELVDDSNRQHTGYLEVYNGEVMREPSGLSRGVRPSIIATVIGEGAYASGDLVSAIVRNAGTNGLTLDEIKFLYPNPSARDRSMGYNWENDTRVMGNDGSQGYVQKAPDGRTTAPIFSGFYLAPNGMYYPINTASLVPQQPTYRGGPSEVPTERKPFVPGQNMPNAGGSGLGNLDQNLF